MALPRERPLQFEHGNFSVSTVGNPCATVGQLPARRILYALLVGEKQYEIATARFCTQSCLKVSQLLVNSSATPHPMGSCRGLPCSSPLATPEQRALQKHLFSDPSNRVSGVLSLRFLYWPNIATTPERGPKTYQTKGCPKPFLGGVSFAKFTTSRHRNRSDDCIVACIAVGFRSESANRSENASHRKGDFLCRASHCTNRLFWSNLKNPVNPYPFNYGGWRSTPLIKGVGPQKTL